MERTYTNTRNNPSLAAFKQGVAMTHKRGTCVLTGLPPGESAFPLFDVVLNCIMVRGSRVGTCQDMAEALALAAEGKVKADIELQRLSDVNQLLDKHLVKHRCLTGIEPIVKEIVDVAKAGDVHLIAMATHGRDLVGRALMGSVAQKVVSHSTVPVLLVK